ncbi:MAG TPA: hypothetical protein H9797_04360 [Candidatus Gallimonas gallistercoris]|uniref:Uncharacterized protein n=1 Tax=Candidatus Gallimonas gallistercoris TaxID=2838602 RepID=A0A9D2KFT3_9FIRM|nr:hypothetical protein [Candidatus Gallimonas gallistercoris]
MSVVRKSCKMAAALLSFALLLGMLLSLSSCRASSYTEEEHIARVTERAKERFLGEGSEYTGLEVYPVYNEYDELKYMLIEFQSQGFLYVLIDREQFPWKMYTLSNIHPESWMPYRVKEGAQEDVYDADGNLLVQAVDREYIRDESGQAVIYHESHFKAAGIEGERRYLLTTEAAEFLGGGSSWIPAVKRGEQYLDLVDGALIDYTPGMESSSYAVELLYFIPKPDFDL